MQQTQYSPEELNQALDRAVLGLFQNPPKTRKGTKPVPSTFITTIYAGLHKTWDEAIPTACTNGLYLKINPTWFMSLSEPMRCTLLAHESWHVGFMHMDRKGERDHKYWNIAADHAINLMLEEYGYQFDIDPMDHTREIGLKDPRFTNMSADQIYDIVSKEQAPIELPFGADFTSGGDGGEPLDDKTRSEIIGLVVQAVTLSRMNGREAGNLPGEIEELVDELLNPKLPWYVLLSRFLNEKSEAGYTYQKPNRRYQCHGLYLPSAGGQEGLEHTLWGCDDSGSMSPENLKTINSEMKDAKERLNPKTMKVVSFDTKVRDVWDFTNEDDLNRLTFTGRGGTNLAPFFEYAQAQKHRPSLLVVMSDLECAIPPDPGFPVLFIRFGTGGRMPDYGHTITVDR